MEYDITVISISEEWSLAIIDISQREKAETQAFNNNQILLMLLIEHENPPG